MDTASQLTVAVVQMTCLDGKVPANLEHAAGFVAQASARGAQLIVFPEFMSPGYRLTPELWSAGEPLDGPTTRWLCEQSRQVGAYIGASFLECDGSDFWNAFALSSPAGKIVGIVHKQFPSIWEAYFFRGQPGPQCIDTELGRIGVGICFDNHTYAVAQAVAASQPNLMLMPHSYCTPTRVTKAVSQADIDRLNDNPIRVARLYNEGLGVPVILVNKSGAWDSPVPNTIFGQPKAYGFSGRSLILDADGTTCRQMGEEEGLAVAEVHLDPACKKQWDPLKYSRYIYPGPVGRELLRLIEWNGSRQYQQSSVRKQVAAHIQRP